MTLVSRSLLGLGKIRGSLSFRILAAIVLFGTATGISGCTTWRSIQLERDPLPNRMRVRDSSAVWIEILDGKIEGDSVLIGYRNPGPREIRIPLDEINASQGRFSNPGATMTLILATPVVVLGLVLVWAIITDPVYTFGPGG